MDENRSAPEEAHAPAVRALRLIDPGRRELRTLVYSSFTESAG